MTRFVFSTLVALLFAACCAPPAHAVLSDTVNRIPSAGANFMRDLQEFDRDEDADRFHENACREDTFVYSGCLGATGASLSHTPSSCIGYAGGYRFTEVGSITYPDDSTCWVIYDKQVTGDLVSGVTFTRIPSTHYLKTCTAGISVTTPTLPTSTGFLMRVITVSGSIQVVSDLRDFGACGEGSGFVCADLTTQACNLCPLVEGCVGVSCAPPYCDVKCFGAIGDGMTDDTAAIQAAFDACAVPGAGTYSAVTHTGCRGGGTVFFPRVTTASGCYKTTATVTGCGVSMLGEGMGASVLCPTDFGTCDAFDEHTTCSPGYSLQSADDPAGADVSAGGDQTTTLPLAVLAEKLDLHGPSTSVSPGVENATTDGIWFSTIREDDQVVYGFGIDQLHVSGFRNGIVEHGLLKRATYTRSNFRFNFNHIVSSYCEATISDSHFSDAAHAVLETDLCRDLVMRHNNYTHVPYVIWAASAGVLDDVVLDGLGLGESVRVGNALIAGGDDTLAANGLFLRLSAQHNVTRDAIYKIPAESDAYMIRLGEVVGYNEAILQGGLGTGTTKQWLIGTMNGRLRIEDDTVAGSTFDIGAGEPSRIVICDLHDRCLPQAIQTLADSTTPSVINAPHLAREANGTSRTVTNLTDGATGQQLTILCTTSNLTINDGGNFKLASNFICTADDTITLVYTGTSWLEVGRSVN